jgi:hypothetical protein
MNLKKVIRCFLVDNQGQQLGQSYIVDQRKLNPNGQFYQLQLGENANWYRKHYIRNALRQPHQMHISPPYQSIKGDGLCITTSMCFDTNKGQKILYMDILAEHSDLFYSLYLPIADDLFVVQSCRYGCVTQCQQSGKSKYSDTIRHPQHNELAAVIEIIFVLQLYLIF